MVDSIVDFFVRISCPFGSELPDCPFFAVFGIEEFHEVFQRVSVCYLRVCCAWAGSGDYVVGNVAEIEACFWMSGSRACDDLAEDRGHCEDFASRVRVVLAVAVVFHCRKGFLSLNSEGFRSFMKSDKKIEMTFGLAWRQ